jgi:hypothetical protein
MINFIDKKIADKMIKMRPDQEALLNIFCDNKHYLTTVKLTPFCTVDILVRCKVCGGYAQGHDMTLSLNKKPDTVTN